MLCCLCVGVLREPSLWAVYSWQVSLTNWALAYTYTGTHTSRQTWACKRALEVCGGMYTARLMVSGRQSLSACGMSSRV